MGAAKVCGVRMQLTVFGIALEVAFVIHENHEGLTGPLSCAGGNEFDAQAMEAGFPPLAHVPCKQILADELRGTSVWGSSFHTDEA